MPTLASFPRILLCGLLLQANAVRAHTDPPAPDAAASAAASTPELAGSFDARMTVEKAKCLLQKVGGESRGTVRVDPGGPGLMIVHLEELNPLFGSPVTVTVTDSNLTFSGPTDVRIGPARTNAMGKLNGRMTPDGNSFVAQFELASLFCTIRGSLDGVRTGAPDTASAEPAAPAGPEGPPPDEAAPPAPAVPPGQVTAGGETPADYLGREVSLQASNYPDRLIRHRFMLGYAERVSDQLGWDDSTFRVVPGLAGKCISLESHNYPNSFLRHHYWRIKLAPREDTDLYRQDATFCMVPGLNGTGGVSLESVNYPQHFIRHRGGELWLDRFDGGDLNRRDATFNVTNPGNLQPPP